MSRQSYQATLDLAMRLVEDTSRFDKEVPWFTNGGRGYLHADIKCRKLRHIDPLRVETVKLSPNAAARKPTCGACFTGGILRVVPPLGPFRRLLHTYESLDDFSSSYSEDIDVLNVFVMLEGVRDIISSLEVPDGAQRLLGPYVSYGMNVAMREAIALEDLFVKRIMSSQDEIVCLAALETFAKTPKLVHALMFTNDDLQILGGSSKRMRSTKSRVLYSAWAEQTAALGVNPGRDLESAVEACTLEKLEQLSGIVPDPLPGEDYPQSALRTWLKLRDTTVSSMFERWDSMLLSKASSRRSKTVGIYRPDGVYNLDGTPIENEELLKVILEVYTVHRNIRVDTSLLWVPKTVETWLSWYAQDSFFGTKVPLVQSYSGRLNPAELETVAALWDPSDRSGSTYVNLNVCVDAAKAVLR